MESKSNDIVLRYDDDARDLTSEAEVRELLTPTGHPNGYIARLVSWLIGEHFRSGMKLS